MYNPVDRPEVMKRKHFTYPFEVPPLSHIFQSAADSSFTPADGMMRIAHITFLTQKEQKLSLPADVRNTAT
jgi:hypothetical protein